MTRVVFGYDMNNRPRADIIIRNRKYRIQIFALIDSGADVTSIPKNVGEHLRLSRPKRNEVKKIRGIGNIKKIKYVERSIEIKIGDDDFFSINVWWLFNNEGEVLVGRNIFDKFDILFKQNPTKQIIFESNKKVYS